MKIVLPGLEGVGDHKQFVVVNVVVAFHKDEELEEIKVGMSVAVGVSLKEDSIRGVLGGISGNGKGFGEI